MPVHRRFVVPRAFAPSESLLGRLFRRWLADARRAEAWFLITLTGLGLLLLLAQYLAWALLQPAIAAAPRGAVAVGFWLAQLGGVLAVVLGALVGFRPALEVTLGPDALHLRQGRRQRTLGLAAIEAARLIPARLVHRHYARYAATDAYVSRRYDELLLIETAGGGPVVVGLPPEEAAALAAHLEAHTEAAYAHVA